MIEEILELKNCLDKVFTIHYSCSGFYNGEAIAPSISSISVMNAKNKELTVFSLADYVREGLCLVDAERKLLNNFADFCNSKDNPVFINWQMCGLMFGFSAIYARCSNFGIHNFDIQNYKTINISSYLITNLEDTLRENNALINGYLSGKQEMFCFESSQFDLIKLSNIAKTKGLMSIFEDILNGKVGD